MSARINHAAIGSDSNNYLINQSCQVSLLRINVTIVVGYARTGTHPDVEAVHQHEIHENHVDRRDDWIVAVIMIFVITIDSDVDLDFRDVTNADSIITSSINSIGIIMAYLIYWRHLCYCWTVAHYRAAVYYSTSDAANSTNCAAVGIRTAAIADVGSVIIVIIENCCCCIATMTDDEIHLHAMRWRFSIFLTVQKHSFL